MRYSSQTLHEDYKEWAARSGVAVTRLNPCRLVDRRQVALHNSQTFGIQRHFTFDTMAKVFRHSCRIVRQSYNRASQVLKHVFHHKDAADQIVQNVVVHAQAPVTDAAQPATQSATAEGGRV